MIDLLTSSELNVMRSGFAQVAIQGKLEQDNRFMYALSFKVLHGQDVITVKTGSIATP